MAETRAGQSGRGRKILVVVSVALLPLLLVLRFGWYFYDRSALEQEIYRSIQAELAALKAEEQALPPGTNAAEVWKRIAGLVPIDPAGPWPNTMSKEEVVARNSRIGDALLDKAAPALALVDEALSRDNCLFSVSGPMATYGPPLLEPPYGPPEQSIAATKIPLLLERRGRLRLYEEYPREALEDVRRMLLSVRQATSRTYFGPFNASGTIDRADELLRDVLRHPALTAADARFAAALPPGNSIFTGREVQRRLHRLHGDIELYFLLRGTYRGKQATNLREELGLPAAVPLLGFSIRDPAAIRALRAAPDRPLRGGGFEKWPENGPLGCLLRLDLLRTAAALRAYQMEHGRSAPDLAGIDTGYLAQASPVYEVKGEGWILRTASNRAPGMFHSLYQDPHWSDCAWADVEMDLSFEWPPK